MNRSIQPTAACWISSKGSSSTALYVHYWTDIPGRLRKVGWRRVRNLRVPQGPWPDERARNHLLSQTR